MTMHGLPIRHWQRPDWHMIRESIGHLVRDPRFWAVIAVGGLIILVAIASLFANQTPSTIYSPYGTPFHPLWP